MATVAAAVIDGTWDAPVLLPDPPAGDEGDDATSDQTAPTTTTAAGADQTSTTGTEGESAAGAGPVARPESRTLPAGTADTLFGLMRRVVTEGSGQAAAISGVEIAGKTGTAEFGQGDPLPTHAWFIGIRGDNAVAVLIEGGGVGGRVAAPIAGAILAGLPGG
jgi:membrane carboxypeptidase/penicillin-binding protein